MNIVVVRQSMGPVVLGLVVLAAGALAPGAWLGVGGGGGAAMAAEGKANACGCYQDSTGSCFCGKKARCGCPGDCEPKGCEEKREKEMRREIDAETKKAQEAGKRYTQARADEDAVAKVGKVGKVDKEASAPRERSTKAAHLSAGQRKELLRLLDLYASERGERGNRTVDQVRGELTNAAP